MMIMMWGVWWYLDQIACMFRIQKFSANLAPVFLPSDLWTPIEGRLNNKLASLGATLVRNYDPLTHSLTDRGKVESY